MKQWICRKGCSGVNMENTSLEDLATFHTFCLFLFIYLFFSYLHPTLTQLKTLITNGLFIQLHAVGGEWVKRNTTTAIHLQQTAPSMLLAGPHDLPPGSKHGCKQAPHELQLPCAECMPFVGCCTVDMVTRWTLRWSSCVKCLLIVDRVMITWARLSSGHTRCFCRRQHVGAHLQTSE